MPNSQGYFANFPSVQYGNVTSLNLTARARIKEQVFGNLNAFYPYTIEEAETPDAVAFNYYDDPHLVWLIFMANDMIDPYYDWPMAQDVFLRYIIKKYGSVSAAQALIKHYIHDTDGHIITPDTYAHGGVTTGDFSSKDAFTIENETNEEKRFIVLLDKQYAGLAVENLKRVMHDR